MGHKKTRDCPHELGHGDTVEACELCNSIESGIDQLTADGIYRNRGGIAAVKFYQRMLANGQNTVDFYRLHSLCLAFMASTDGGRLHVRFGQAPCVFELSWFISDPVEFGKIEDVDLSAPLVFMDPERFGRQLGADARLAWDRWRGQ